MSSTKVRSRSEQRNETRAAILEAAIELFSRKGYEGAATTEIARACNAPVPLIMYHFESKEGLWRAAVSEIYRRIERALDEGMAGLAGLEGEAALRTAVKVQITAIARHPEYMRLLLHEGAQHSERLVWLVETHQRRLSERSIELIRFAQYLGYAPDIDPMHAKYIYSGAFSLAIALAPEYEVMTGERLVDDAFIDRHIDACFEVLFQNRSRSG
ncbi:MAG: TetR/AcrR family transcriptional regulator [Parvularculaceae bacterium]